MACLASGSQPGAVLPLEGHLAMSGDSFRCPSCGERGCWRLVGTGQGCCLNIPPCTAQGFAAKNCLVQDATHAKMRSLDPDLGSVQANVFSGN
jgi:hypothetical protein